MDRRRAGELETEILTALWTAGEPLSPSALQSALPGDLAYTTVSTTLSRLTWKRLVTRVPTGYRSTRNPAHLAADQMHATLTQEPDPARTLHRFVSSLHPTDTAVLRALLARQ